VGGRCGGPPVALGLGEECRTVSVL